MPSKQAERRKLAKLRAELHATPWAIDARVLGMLSAGIEESNLEAVEATLTLGRREEDDKPYQPMGNVAVIPVTGVLQDQDSYMVRWGFASSYQLIEKAYNQALDDEQIKSILFYFDTPGGSAIGCKRVADLIFENRGIKAVRGFVQTMCASAGYYLGAACDRIDATADSLVGSIGTIFPHQEFSGMLAELGIKATVITNSESPKKGHGNIYEPLSDEARKSLQGFVESYGAAFVSDVARFRGVDRDVVTSTYGQGDAMRADIAIRAGIVDALVESFEETLSSLQGGSNSAAVPANTLNGRSVMNERIKAQLFALGLIDSVNASDESCEPILAAWFKASGKDVPSDEAATLVALQRQVKAQDEADDEEDEEEEEVEETSNKSPKGKKGKLQAAHDAEQYEARLENLQAAADLLNSTVGSDVVSASMVLDAVKNKQSVPEATKAWQKKIAESESPIATVKLKGEGADRYAADIVDALVYRASDNPDMQLSDNAKQLVNRPLWAVAGECLQLAGQQPDMYGSRELLAEEAMQMGEAHRRHTFYSAGEDRRYIQASGVPNARPGDFPNILSALANKFLDTIQLDDDYTYPMVSAVLPGGLNDFKPAMMVNKGIVEELDEVQDAEAFNELGLQEEVLSYIFLRRFGNKWGWTPVLVANDDMNAFAEGMLGLEEAWQVTQNRLVVDLFTSNPTLLDGNALFANRADTGTGTNPAANNNIASSGGAPSDTTWSSCETAYADIGGIATGRRVRGSLNTIFVPTGAQHHEAVRTFAPYNLIGETKDAATTSNIGLYRGKVAIVPESELRVSSALIWYALRSPTRLNTATVVRAYFNGYGTAGRRERWYDPTNKTTWVSIEGRIATAVKNWRYAVRNAGQ